tara:strand:- start:2324 stop:3178 length:855 start_codon:yes stop_codon:yes gene_type:complete
MFWKSIFFTIEAIFEMANVAQNIVFKIESLFGANKHISRNIQLKNSGLAKKIFIVGNGPSVKKQNISDLKYEEAIFVNMGFKHPHYITILPRYHVLVDPKLANGEWDIGILDEIVSLNPNVTLVLNGKWFNKEKFKPYIDNPAFKIIWVRVNLFVTRFHKNKNLNISTITYGMGVLGASLALANYLGSREIVLLGVESNAFCYEFERKESHFYGINKDNINMDSEGVYKSLFFNYLYLMGLHNLSTRSKSICITNCTPGGILKMFERDILENKLVESGAKNDKG